MLNIFETRLPTRYLYNFRQFLFPTIPDLDREMHPRAITASAMCNDGRNHSSSPTHHHLPRPIRSPLTALTPPSNQHTRPPRPPRQLYAPSSLPHTLRLIEATSVGPLLFENPGEFIFAQRRPLGEACPLFSRFPRHGIRPPSLFLLDYGGNVPDTPCLSPPSCLLRTVNVASLQFRSSVPSS